MRIVVTAGPTREPIDPVRFISNRSSGKMGYAISEAALEAGHEVTLISGPSALVPPAQAHFLQITTSDELFDAVHEAARDCDLLVMCAAVADYKPTTRATEKMAKQTAPFALQLMPTRDILSSLSHDDRKFFVVGFAAETHDLQMSAQRKLISKNCDMMVANDVSRDDSGMESDLNEVVIFARNHEPKTISRASKKVVARELMKIVFEIREKSLTKKS